MTLKLTPTSLIERLPSPLEYADGDIVIIDDLTALPGERQLHIDMVVVLVCTAGRAQFSVNGSARTIERGQLAIFPPNVLVDNYMISPDFSSKIIGLSYAALERILPPNNEIWAMVSALSANPVFAIDEAVSQHIVHYYSLLTFKLSRPEGRYRKETMLALFQAIFYDLCQLVADRQGVMAPAPTQGAALVREFTRLIANDGGRHRSVAYFATRLCVSAKYLSAVCTKTTGRSPKEWILEYCAEVLRHQLRYSSLTIKEISCRMDFPSLSAFGKFARATLGMSPTAYRAQ